MTPGTSRERIASLGRPRDAVGLAVTAWVAALTAVAFALATQHHVLPWAAGQLLLAITLVQWFAILHECGHRTLYRSRLGNRLVGHLASVFAMIPFHSWQRVHAEHHRWTGWQDLDPTTAALVPRPLARVERLIVNTCWKLWIPLFSVLYRVNNFWNLRRLFALFASPVEHRRCAVNVLGLAAVYAAAVALVGWWELARLVGAGVVASLIVEDALLLSQHTHIPQQIAGGHAVRPVPPLAQAVYTRSLRCPRWLSLGVLFGMDAHELHHMYPQLPGYRAARLGAPTDNAIHWLEWVRLSRRVPAETLLFQNRAVSGIRI